MNDREEISVTISEFVKAYDAGDLTGVLAYYSDDLIKVRQGGPPETKPQIAKRLAEVFNRFSTRVEVVNEEIDASADLAFTRGTFRVTLKPRSGGEDQVIERRYLEIWRKEKGKWLVFRTMDNTP